MSQVLLQIVMNSFIFIFTGAGIISAQMGSDHCPVTLEMKAIPPLPPHPTPSLSSALLQKPAVCNTPLSHLTPLEAD